MRIASIKSGSSKDLILDLQRFAESVFFFHFPNGKSHHFWGSIGHMFHVYWAISKSVDPVLITVNSQQIHWKLLSFMLFPSQSPCQNKDGHGSIPITRTFTAMTIHNSQLLYCVHQVFNGF